MDGDTLTTRGSEPSQAPEFDIGVLLIHGIGAQRRGQTLAEFGGPVYHWIVERFERLDRRWREVVHGHPEQSSLETWRYNVEEWATDGFHPKDRSAANWQQPDKALIAELAQRLKCNTSVGRARFTDALVADPDDPSAPAHAELRMRRQRLDGSLSPERWLLAESWWAETFLPPSFAQLGRWGLRVIPWTIGSHFGARVRRLLKQRPGSSAGGGPNGAKVWMGWLGRVFAAVLGLAAGLLASPLLLAALAVLLLLSLLPIPQVREALLKMQLAVASTLGDSYVLVSRPVEAASIVGQVRRDLNWLAARCNVIAVVAHSQGGAVAHAALEHGVPPKLQLLFTFGSGLKKLEELKHALSSGSTYLRSGLFTVLAVPFFAVTSLWFVLLFGAAQSEVRTELMSQAPWVLAYWVISVLFLVAGLRDYIGGMELPQLERWTQRLLDTRLSWMDCFSSADPVSNGLVVERPDIEDLSMEVCNQASILKDHTSYWSNRDEFVTLLVACLTSAKLRDHAGLPPAPELGVDEEELDWISARRRWRVGILSAIGWIGIASIALAVYQEPKAWLNFLRYLGNTAASSLGKLIGSEAEVHNAFSVHWPAVGYLAAALLPLWITRSLWHKWNGAEMRAFVKGEGPIMDMLVYTGMWLQLTIAAGLMYGRYPPTLVFFVCLLAPFTVAMLTQPKDHVRTKVPAVAPGERESRGEELAGTLLNLALFLAWPFSMAWGAWEFFIWLAGHFGGAIFGFRPGDVSSVLIGVAGSIVFFVGFLWIQHRNQKRASADREGGL